MVRKEAIMQKQRYVRWVVDLDQFKEINITEKLCSAHMPINRMLREVGHYPMDFIDLGDVVYYYTFHEDEEQTPKSEVMLGRFNIIDGKMHMDDMSEKDLENLDVFYEKIFFIKKKETLPS